MADTSELGLLQMGVAEVIKPATGEHLGYVYATPDAGGTRLSDEGAQYQRWFLRSATGNDFEVRPQTRLSFASVEKWNAWVTESWQPGSRYIWARARIYKHGGTYGRLQWTSLPTDERLLPKAQDPNAGDIDFQLDVGGGKVLELNQERTQGLAYVCARPAVSATVEYWCTTPSFQPSGRTGAVKIATGPQTATRLSDFLRLAAPTWAPGSTLSIVGCVSYTGDVAYDRL